MQVSPEYPFGRRRPDGHDAPAIPTRPPQNDPGGHHDNRPASNHLDEEVEDRASDVEAVDTFDELHQPVFRYCPQYACSMWINKHRRSHATVLLDDKAR